MALKFTKMHGCGNDYIYLDCFESTPENLPELAKKLSVRHFSIGSDGLICICKSSIAAARMEMYNADGSRSPMCGNGVRCVAQWLFEHGRVGDVASVETDAGIKNMHRVGDGDWQVDMGYASFEPEEIPVKGMGAEPVVGKDLMVGGKAYSVTCVSMGNPHCITLVKDVAGVQIEKLGPAFEHHAAFPVGVNTEFVQVVSPEHLKMRVWERGSGETLACGTGACAVAAACVALGISPRETDIKVELLGGDLMIRVDREWRVQMTGPAVTVCEGEVKI